MKKVISKLDGKEYYLTVCNDESNVMFICNKRYQVRNATSDDCCNLNFTALSTEHSTSLYLTSTSR